MGAAVGVGGDQAGAEAAEPVAAGLQCDVAGAGAADLCGDLQRAGAERVVEAARHAAGPHRDLGLALDHFPGRGPGRPFGLAPDISVAVPAEPVAADIGAITRAFASRGVQQDGRDTALVWGEDVPVRGKPRIGVTTALHEDQERELAGLAKRAAGDRSAALSPGAIARAVARREVMPLEEGGLRFEGAQFTAIGSNPVVSVGKRPLKDWQAVKKTVFDRAIGGALLLGAALPLLVVAALIKLDSPGPVLFRQPRVGFDNRMFSIFKLRTMRADMTDLLADRQTTRDDPRVTRVGRWLRRYSIDELPQLLNVMQGSMSLVGPRPHAPNTKAADKLFADVVSQYAVRHRVKPGITGWAQVRCGYAGSDAGSVLKASCDLYYVRHHSFGMDCLILFETLRTLLFDQQWQGVTGQPTFVDAAQRAALTPAGRSA